METNISMYEKQMDRIEKLDTLEKVSGQSVDHLISLFEESNASNTPIYIYRDAVNWIKNETGISEDAIVDVIESEERYMVNIGLTDDTHIREGLEMED